MSPYTYSRNRKTIVNAAMAGFALATLFCMLHEVAVQECHLFHNLVWVALEVMRPAISAAWQSAPAHLCEGSNLLRHLLQIVASIRPLLGVIAAETGR
jgi:hypothetical protein